MDEPSDFQPHQRSTGRTAFDIQGLEGFLRQLEGLAFGHAVQPPQPTFERLASGGKILIFYNRFLASCCPTNSCRHCSLTVQGAAIPILRNRFTLQQFMQEPQLAANVMQADLHQRIVVAFEPLVGLPVHPFGFVAVTIQDASFPAQAFAQLVGTAGCPVPDTLFLRGVNQPATLAAGEVPAWRIQNRHPLVAPWAGKPVSLAAHVARRGLRLHSLLDQFVGTLHTVGKHYALQIYLDIDSGDFALANQPLPAKAVSGHQQALAGDFPKVQRH